MQILKNWKVKPLKTVEFILLILMIAGLCTQNPVLAHPVLQPNNSKNTPSQKVTGSTTSTNAFISTWNTSEPGITNSTTIALPLVSTGSYSFNVTWGDGNSNIITTYNQPAVNHTYSSAGIYTLYITGAISGWEFNNGGDAQKIIEISQWGILNLGNTGSYFEGAKNLNINATDSLNMTGTTNFFLAFQSCANLGSSGNFASWNTSAVTNMLGMFSSTDFNGPIGNWNTSSVITMESMFQNDNIFNQNISNWDVSHVTDFSWMFTSDAAFNQPIGNWNTSSATTMAYMFFNAAGFNQSLANWTVTKVTTMNQMFSLATIFNQNVSNWDVSHVTNMGEMFFWDSAFNWPIENWNVSSVTTMQQMFDLDTAFNQHISKWNVSHVINMDSMFDQDSAFNQNISSWDVSSVTTMGSMFSSSSFNQSIGNWNVSQVTDMSSMFEYNYAFNQNISAWNVGKVTTMDSMFAFSSFNNPIGNWSVSNVTTMNQMFYANSVFNQSIGNWNVSQVTIMSSMFYDDYAFNQPLGTWNVSNVYTMVSMFTGDTLSYQNYDNLLIGWSKLTLQIGVELYAGNSQYSYKAVSAKQSIINTYGWYIFDNGEYNLTAPQSVQAFSGYNSVLLNWSEPSSNGGSAVTGYSIYRSTTSGSGFILINTVSASTFSYNDTSLSVKQTYYYIISATNGIGNRTNSSIVSATTNSVPSAPQSLQAQPGFESVVISWQTPVTDGGSAITGYNIYVSTDGGSTYSLVTAVGPSTFTYNDTGLANGITYYFEVNATNSAGIGLSPSAVYATPYTIPDAPQFLAASPGNTFVMLTWQSPIFSGGSAITGYNIYSSTDNITYNFVTTVSGSLYYYNDTGLINGQTYYFEISASNIAGSSPYSTVVNATPNITNAPSVPNYVTAQSGNGYIVLSWYAPINNGGSAISNYTIYRSSTSGTGFVSIKTVNANTYSYNDTGLTNGQSYYYIVSVTNAAGLSTNSTQLLATSYTISSAPQSLTAKAGKSSVLLAWLAPSSNGGSAINSYYIYYSTISSKTLTLVTHVSASTLSYNDTGLTGGLTYYFVVSAVNNAGFSPYSNGANATPYPVPTAPQSLQAQSGNTYVFLSWNVPTSNGGLTITGYNIYVSTDGGSSFTLLKSVSSSTLSYNDTGLTNGQTYYFKVTANNSAGKSPYSSVVSATPAVPINNSSNTTTTSNTSNQQSTESTSTNSRTATTTSGFLFIFPIIGMIFIYFKRHKKN